MSANRSYNEAIQHLAIIAMNRYLCGDQAPLHYLGHEVIAFIYNKRVSTVERNLEKMFDAQLALHYKSKSESVV